MEAPSESILIRIKKLLSLSEKNDNEHQAAEAAKKAQELLIRYNLELEDVQNIETEKKEPFIQQYYRKHAQGRYRIQRWKVLLAFEVAEGNLCEVWSGNDGKNLIWHGKPSNIEVGQYLFETLCYDLERIADIRWDQILELRKLQTQYPSFQFFTDYELTYIHGKAWKDSFFRGAVDVIGDRLRAGLRDLRKENNLNALITLNDQALAAFIKEKYPKHRGGSYHGGGFSALSGYAAGKEAGKTIQFKRGVNGAGGAAGPRLLKG